METEREVVFGNGKKVSVHKATHLMSLQRASLTLKASKEWEGKKTEDDIELQLLKYDETVLYPSLFACSSGKKLPTLKEFQSMPEDDVELWIEVASEINPRWFVVELSSEEQKVEEEKKEPEPIALTVG